MSKGSEIIKRFWRGEPFAFDGKFHRFPRIEPWPRTHQREIPIWIAASNDRAGFERAGAGGYNLMMNQYPMSLASLVEKHEWYKAAYAAAGHDPAKRKSAVAFMTYLADREDDAIEGARVALQEHAGAFRKVFTHDEWNRDYEGDVSTLLAMCEGDDYRDVFRKRTLICTPAQAAERLLRYKALGFTEAIFIARFGKLSAAQSAETMTRLSREVRPMLGLAA